MRDPDLETLVFFDGHQDALKLYQAFESLLYDTFPGVRNFFEPVCIRLCFICPGKA